MIPTDGLIKRAVVVDVEATGLSTENDDVIQLAILPFDYEPESGRILNHAVHRRIGASFNDYGGCAHMLLRQAPGGPPRNGASGLLVLTSLKRCAQSLSV
jgi:DNA polymerase III epsilon subunit-like protein